MKILLLGGSGTLGQELVKIAPDIIAPVHQEVDITDFDTLNQYIIFTNPDVIINAAAIIDNRLIEKYPPDAIRVNIIGSANVSIICYQSDIRLVYISTDYVYKGTRGNYLETDEILPFNSYSWTKLGGECSTTLVRNHLIIRTSFGKNFSYPEAFVDKWSSKDYVDRVAPLIYQASISPLTGVLNLGTQRKTLYTHALERNVTVKPLKIKDSCFSTPYDTSLNLQKWVNYISEKPIVKPHTHCRICGSTNLTKYLDLGLIPLANNLEFTAQRAREAERFPLQILLCEDCALSQLSVVIDPEKMFSYYTYRSSINQGYINHCKKMAEELSPDLSTESFIIDIAGNDGTLLKQFKDLIGLKVLNVDPATNLVAVAESQGIPSIADFWSVQLAEKIVSSYGKADLITATNVFAHVDNIRAFLQAAKISLNFSGILILEFPYLIDFIKNHEFDTTYFEHLSYLSVLPIIRLCESLSLKIINIEKQDIHGGTIRVTISHHDSFHQVSDSVNKFIDKEEQFCYNCTEKYIRWSKDIKTTINEFSLKILDLKRKGYRIAAFAASAKGNTLLNSTGINTDIISYIVDETPEKIGKYSPGTGIPIVHKQALIDNPPNYLIILSWNFKEEIISKVKSLGYKGKFIIPIPHFHEL